MTRQQRWQNAATPLWLLLVATVGVAVSGWIAGQLPGWLARLATQRREVLRLAREVARLAREVARLAQQPHSPAPVAMLRPLFAAHPPCRS